MELELSPVPCCDSGNFIGQTYGRECSGRKPALVGCDEWDYVARLSHRFNWGKATGKFANICYGYLKSFTNLLRLLRPP